MAPAAASIVLSLHSAFGQIGMAAGAGIGGIAVTNGLLQYLPWIGALALTLSVAVIVTDHLFAKSTSIQELEEMRYVEK
ncbi:hypothetical protein ACRPK8_06865 [Exiguobacterium sp. TDN 0502]|uniref:hypothetical protein n=1 Tax=Exiguobacterium sp. TDN 0502 TaxID=3420731 RepID=UPI003D77B380